MDFLIFWVILQKISNRRSWAVFFNLRLPMGERGFWYVDITKSMCGWPPEFVRKLSAGGGAVVKSNFRKISSGRWEDGRFFGLFFSWTLNIWIWMKLFFHFVEWQLNWDSETCRISYQKVLQKKNQTQSYANRFFKQLLPPKLVRTWARILSCGHKVGKSNPSKNTVKKSHGYFSTKRTSRFPRLKKHSEKPWIRGF